MGKQNRETDMEFLAKIRMVYQTTTEANDEGECLFVYFGKLPSNLQDKILEWKDVEELSFEELDSSRSGRDSEFKGLSDLRSKGAPKAISTDTMPQAQRAVCSSNSDLY